MSTLVCKGSESQRQKERDEGRRRERLWEDTDGDGRNSGLKLSPISTDVMKTWVLFAAIPQNTKKI